MLFSPYIDKIDISNGIGYCFCGMLFIHLLVNIAIIAVVTAKKSLNDFRRWLIIRKELIKLKEITKKQKELQKYNHFGIRKKNFVECEESP